MQSILEEANKLCQEIYGQTYHEVYGFDQIDEEEIRQHIIIMKRKSKFINRDKIYNDGKSNFFTIWREYWSSMVVDQPIVCELYALCALSQLLKHINVIKAGGKEDDIRIHICTIMPSGTGKSEANDVLATFARQVGLVYSTVDRYNDASLVGSINKQAVENNGRHGYSPGMPGWMDPDEKGILRKSDFVVFDEGENILKTSQFTEGAQRYLQKAMNRMGSEGNFITNTLVGFTVGGYPDCSCIITSYYLDEFQDTLLDRGLLQRMIVYIQDESYDTRTNIINSIIDGIPTFDKDPKETVPYVEGLLNAKMDRIQRLRDEAIKIKKFHAGTKTVAIRYTAKSSLREGITQLRELMPMMIGQKQIWESMITRMTINMLKVAAIHALSNYRTYIDEPDIEYAASLMMQTMKSMGFFLREKVTTDIDKKTMQIYNSLRRKFIGIKNTSMEWENAIIENMNLSPNRAKQIVSTLIENGKLEEISNKGQKAYIIK